MYNLFSVVLNTLPQYNSGTPALSLSSVSKFTVLLSKIKQKPPIAWQTPLTPTT
jgi:hypothetical protein